MPSNAKLLPFRSNVPHLADFCLTPVDEGFPARAKAEKGGILVAGQNYGQGSSREHAALVPLYLGIRAVAAKSFARIHQANLINNGILPLTFVNEADYDRIDQMDELSLPGVREKIRAGEEILQMKNETKGETYEVRLVFWNKQNRPFCSALAFWNKQNRPFCSVFGGVVFWFASDHKIQYNRPEI